MEVEKNLRMDSNTDKLETRSTTTPLSSRRGVGGEVELRSEEVQEILSRPPHALIRYGISIITGVLFVIFIGSFFFRYPDIVNGEVIITTENPPIWLVAKSTGRISEISCADAQIVKQGTILGIIENPATTKDILLVRDLLKDVVINEGYCLISDSLLTSSFELGSVQNSFSSFIRAAVNYNNFLTLNLSNQDKLSLEKQIEHKKAYAMGLVKQLDIKKKELQLTRKAYDRDKKLFLEKVISAYELELTEQAYLNKQLDLQQFESTISINNVEAVQMRASVNKLFVQYQQEHIQLLSDLQSAQRELNSSFENWMQNYAMIAPRTGRVTFNTFWKTDQYVSVGDKVFAVIPTFHGKYIGKLQIPTTGSGKVAIGQRVNVKVAGYPYLEYGLLKAQTKSISLVANNSFYSVQIEFPEGLKTSVNKQLKFDGELSGSAEIITENRTLIERIFTPVKLILQKSFE
jgi:HlyD family secretion protein